MFARFPLFPLARFSAGDARTSGFNLTVDPEGDIPDRSPDHVVLTISDPQATGGAKQRAAKSLALKAVLLHRPETNQTEAQQE
jgi:hypothetical protein